MARRETPASMKLKVYSGVNGKPWLARLGTLEGVNFLLTNRIPRIFVTRLMGRLSKCQNPALVSFMLWIWSAFTPLDLSEAAPGEYKSLRDIFTRRLRPGARPINPEARYLISPCDGILGEFGRISHGQLFQAKGMPYALEELLNDQRVAQEFEGGTYVTLRLTSVMYHRFHAPRDCVIEEVVHHQGDTWNVNPPALARIRSLYCRNERAVIRCADTADGRHFILVPVAAISVAGLRIHAIPFLLNVDYRGQRRFRCAEMISRGDELGWFEHGSTIIILVTPGWNLLPELHRGAMLRMGEALLERENVEEALPLHSRVDKAR